MISDPIQAGMAGAAFALILGALYLFVSGGSSSIGEQVRGILTPALRAIRDGSTLSRGDLADRTVLLGAALVLSSAVTRLSIIDLAIAIVLYRARPKIKSATKQEQPLLAIAGFFSTDMIVGVYTPMLLALFMLGDIAVALGLSTVVIALCWPPGGAGQVSGEWRPAWVNA